MRKPDIDRLLEFQKLLLEFSKIERVIHREHNDSYVMESDTEHSYNLAMTAWFLSEYFPDMDMDLLIRYSLVHDLVEVHAGDTYVYADPALLASKESREAAALVQLKEEWKDFSDMSATIEEYEKKLNKESKFVYALDKIMPMMAIYINNGYTWQQESITLEKLHEIKVDKVALSPDIAVYYSQLYDLLLTRPDLIPLK